MSINELMNCKNQAVDVSSVIQKLDFLGHRNRPSIAVISEQFWQPYLLLCLVSDYIMCGSKSLLFEPQHRCLSV